MHGIVLLYNKKDRPNDRFMDVNLDEGTTNKKYALASLLHSWIIVPPSCSLGFWRSGHDNNNLTVNSLTA